MIGVDHEADGKRNLKRGLEFVAKGDVDGAVEALFQAAASFDRAQDFRLIPAIWEAIGNMLEPDFKEKRKEYLKLLRDGKTNEVYDIWYQFPLVHRIHVAAPHLWKKQKDPLHRQAWAYSWAAEHLQYRAEHKAARHLFLMAAEKAEQTKDGKDYPDWPAKLWYKAVLNCIREKGTTEDEETKRAMGKMEDNYLKFKDNVKRYAALAAAYRNIKSCLMEAGNLAEAGKFKGKEHSAITRYYFSSKSYFRALAEWLSGTGFLYFVMGLFVANLFIFPFLYFQWNLVASAEGEITFLDAVLYSIESGLNIGHSESFAIGNGKLLNAIEGALSWLALSVFIWWLTRRLE